MKLLPVSEKFKITGTPCFVYFSKPFQMAHLPTPFRLHLPQHWTWLLPR